MNIFFDLDGTLIDSRKRVYHLFQELVPQSRFTFDEYWDLKRNKIGHNQILKKSFAFSDAQFQTFEINWMARIEAPEWLAFDIPFPEVTEYLQDIKQRHALFIVTARQLTNQTIDQIDRFEWKNLFNDILITNQKRDKSDLIVNATAITPNDWIVGDTGKDIEVGKKIGIQTAAVLSGFLSEAILQTYSPDKIVERVTALRF